MLTARQQLVSTPVFLLILAGVDACFPKRQPVLPTHPRAYFSSLVREGFIDRIGSGVYSCPKHDGSETMDYAEAHRVAPNGVVCLFSALRIHGITLENPHRTHIALPRGARRPKTALPLEFHSFSGAAYAFGIEKRTTPDGPFKVYSVEKPLPTASSSAMSSASTWPWPRSRMPSNNTASPRTASGKP